MASRNYICERCGAPAAICHHRIYLTPANINDPSIALSWDNLEALCMECHNREHMTKQGNAIFDEAGNVVGVRESDEVEAYKAALNEIDRLKSGREI